MPMRPLVFAAALLTATAPAWSQTASDTPDAAEVARQERLERNWKNRSGQAIRSVCSDCRSERVAQRPSRAAPGARPEPEAEPPLPDLRDERMVLPEDRFPLLRLFGAR